jgi:uncharacterized protein YegL
MTIEWVTPHWFWALIPLLILGWWFQRRSRLSCPSQPVASLQLWDRLVAIPSPASYWVTFIPVLILLLLAGSPRSLTSDTVSHRWTRSLGNDIRLDLGSPGPVDEIRVKYPDGSSKILPFESSQNLTSTWFREIPQTAALEIRSGEAEWNLPIPAEAGILRVCYRSESPSLILLLETLEKENWIRRVKDPEGADIIIGPADFHPVVHIAFAHEGDSTWLPLIESPASEEPLFEGLDPSLWTITASLPVTEGKPILKTADGKALLSRTTDGFLWGFDPDSGDLGDRSDWPLVMLRMLAELSVKPIEAPNLNPAPVIPWALLASVILGLTLLAFTGRRSWPCLLAILAAIWIGSQTDEISWNDVSDSRSLLEIPPSLPMGTRLTFSEMDPVPDVDFLHALSQRGLGWTVEETDPTPSKLQPWTLSAHVVNPGETIDLQGARSQEGWTLTSPEGITESFEVPLQKSEPGIWTVADPAGRELLFLVRSPIEVILSSTDGSGLWPLFSDPRFQILESSSLGKGLPTPAEGRIFAWDGAELPTTIVEQLPSWTRSGGTVFAVSGDSICEDEQTRGVLEDVLGAPLPEIEERELDMGVLLLDLSGSLIGESATTLLESMLAILDTPYVGLRWGVAGFRTDVDWLLEPGSLIESGTVNLLEAEIRSGGGTRLGHALEKILEEWDSSAGSPRLLVLTDGRTVPDDWSTIGARLAAAEINLEILLVGESVTRAAAEELVQAAEGSLQWARSPEEALLLMSEWIPEDLPGWRQSRAPLIQDSASPLVSGFPARLPLPDQILNPGPVDSQEFPATPIWRDSNDQTLLSSHPTGSGQGLLWWSGLNSNRLGKEAIPVVGRVRDLLATAAGRSAVREREGVILHESAESAILCLKREFDEPPALVDIQVKTSMTAPFESQIPVAQPGDFFYSAEIPAANGFAIWKTDSQAGLATELTWSEVAAFPWLGLTSEQTPARGGQPWPPLLILAALLWISSPVNRR